MNANDKGFREPIQGGATTVAWDRSDTELARVIASRRGWLTSGDRVLDSEGKLIARSIEDAAAAMRDRQWFMNARSIFWSTIENERDPEAAIRGSLDSQGRHSSLPV